MTSRAGQGGFQDWQELRNHAIEVFGETPHPITEQEIIDAYQLHPDAVQRAVSAVATDVKTGKARSGWAVLRTRASSIRTPPSNPEASSSRNREKAISHAEQWIRAAGIHFGSPSEILDELFGDRGQLRPYAQVDLESNGATWHLTEPRGDTQLATRMVDYWKDHRPTGIQIEEDATERAEKWKQQHTARQALAQAQAEAAIDNHEQAPLTDIDYAADNHPPGDLHDPPTTDLPL